MFSSRTAIALRRSTCITLVLVSLMAIFNLKKTLTSKYNTFVYYKGQNNFFTLQCLCTYIAIALQELPGYFLDRWGLEGPEDIVVSDSEMDNKQRNDKSGYEHSLDGGVLP